MFKINKLQRKQKKSKSKKPSYLILQDDIEKENLNIQNQIINETKKLENNQRSLKFLKKIN